eukprot:8091390-Heterocapsa_arctica.AAC.1
MRGAGSSPRPRAGIPCGLRRRVVPEPSAGPGGDGGGNATLFIRVPLPGLSGFAGLRRPCSPLQLGRRHLAGSRT